MLGQERRHIVKLYNYTFFINKFHKFLIQGTAKQLSVITIDLNANYIVY
jgi:hypothetical protein